MLRHGHFNTPCSPHIAQILVSLPVTLGTAGRSPVDTPCMHREQAAAGLAWWQRPSPGPPPCQGSRSQSREAKKALKEAARPPGLHLLQQLKWKPAPEAPGLAPPGQRPRFSTWLPGGGTGGVIRTGLPAPALVCICTCARVLLVHGPSPCSGQRPRPSRSEQWQSPRVHPSGLSFHRARLPACLGCEGRCA